MCSDIAEYLVAVGGLSCAFSRLMNTESPVFLASQIFHSLQGNIVLTDHELTIMNILRPRADNSQDVKFAVREKYPVELAKSQQESLSIEA